MMVAGAVWIAVVKRRHGDIWPVPMTAVQRKAAASSVTIGTMLVLRKNFGAVNLGRLGG